MTKKSRTLIVRHLPSCLTEAEKIDLLKYFGGESVRCMSTTGRLRHTAFVTFPTQEAADNVLSKLHQAELLGQRLVVEYADGKQVDKHLPSKIDDFPSQNPDKEANDEPQLSAQDVHRAKMEEFARKIHSMCPELGLDYILNPMLRYAYPPPSPSIIANICAMLVSVPKFYTQVLHLMNKMNLPAPFGPLLPQPPMMHSLAMTQNVPRARRESSSSFEESEMETDEEVAVRPSSDLPAPPVKRRTKLKMKRPPKLQKLLQPIPAGPPKATKDAAEVFEPVFEAAPAKQIAFKIGPQLTENVPKDSADIVVQEGGFGVMTSKPSLPEQDHESSTDNPYTWDSTEFLTSDEIRNGRISSEEMKQASVFRNYDSGVPASRLYVKNVAKGVEVEDLFKIYGGYVDRTSYVERNAFDVRLMKEGRMKGQAFLTFANEKEAERALRDTNGFLLKGKPLVVQFARSAKPKAAS